MLQTQLVLAVVMRIHLAPIAAYVPLQVREWCFTSILKSSQSAGSRHYLTERKLHLGQNSPATLIFAL